MKKLLIVLGLCLITIVGCCGNNDGAIYYRNNYGQSVRYLKHYPVWVGETKTDKDDKGNVTRTYIDYYARGTVADVMYEENYDEATRTISYKEMFLVVFKKQNGGYIAQWYPATLCAGEVDMP